MNLADEEYSWYELPIVPYCFALRNLLGLHMCPNLLECRPFEKLKSRQDARDYAFNHAYSAVHSTFRQIHHRYYRPKCDVAVF